MKIINMTHSTPDSCLLWQYTCGLDNVPNCPWKTESNRPPFPGHISVQQSSRKTLRRSSVTNFGPVRISGKHCFGCQARISWNKWHPEDMWGKQGRDEVGRGRLVKAVVQPAYRWSLLLGRKAVGLAVSLGKNNIRFGGEMFVCLFIYLFLKPQSLS